ncbi:MAG: hypothetical protein QM736_07505 [Vicinamibacterales bacterium]
MRRIYALVVAMTCVPVVAGGHGAGPHDGRIDDGQRIFRYDTFGDEQLWTNVLRMHDVVAQVPPATALAVGLKVDVQALPPRFITALRAGRIDLTDPAVTVELLRLDAIVGLQGTVNRRGDLTSVGITCALCHSSVDDSFAKGIGRRMDGWANTDLNVGAIRRTLAGAGRRDQGGVQCVGTGQVRSTSSRFRRNEHHSAEQPVAADRHPTHLWAEGCRLRDGHGRRSDFLLEQLRRRRPDGRSRNLQGSAHRTLHHAETRFS